MNNGIVADADIIANMHLCLLIRTVQYSAILHIHAVAHPNGIYISTNDGIEPNAATISHLYISHNGGIWCQKTIFSKDRLFPLYR